MNKLSFIVLLILFDCLVSCTKEKPVSSVDYTTLALQTADYLLSQQNADGAIQDEPGGETVNIDSDMEYSLIGLAAAYWKTNNIKYLNGFEKGIHWIAAREEMTDPIWKGSWYYAYSKDAPYAPIPMALDNDIEDVRGVDATSSLFVYLLYLHKILTGSDAMVNQYELQAKAALDFIIDHNQSNDGYFYSSWQKLSSDNQWHLWKFRYAADQGDVYLGMQSGYLLFNDTNYQQKALFLKQNICPAFFSFSENRYAIGMEEDGSFDLEVEDFDAIFPQGYLTWIFGENQYNNNAYYWLSHCKQADGSLSCYSGDPKFSLSVLVYAMGASSLGQSEPTASLAWLKNTTYDIDDGGVRDTSDPESEKYSNVQGFTIIALLKFPTMLF